MPSRDWTTATDEEVMDADLVFELGLDALPEAEVKSILLALNERVKQTVLEHAVDELDDGVKSELRQLVVAGDPEALNTALEQHVPDYLHRLAKETVRFKRIMLQESPEEKKMKAAGQALLDELVEENNSAQL